ncbi:MAG TPA: phosphotransferase [Chloroflexia bacterium]|nr:phosphotransferase [Chloroflexia bacterium]
MQPFETLGHGGQVRRLKRLGQAALEEYPIRVVRLTPLVHEENTTFRAVGDDGAHYVLRITRPGESTIDLVRSEMLWLAALRRDTKLVVPEPVATRSGDLLVVVAVEGVPEPRICVLFRWVEGRFLNSGLTERHLWQVGEFTARLHDHAQSFKRPDGFVRREVDRVDAEWESNILRELGEARPQADVETMQAAIERIRAQLERLGQAEGVFGLIHADLHQWNYLFHKGEVRAIDFDDCGNGHHLYDLGVSLYELEEHSRRRELRAALLAGYRSVRQLPSTYESALPAFLMLRRIHIIQWQVDSRDHPAFRDRWEGGVTYDLGVLRSALDEPNYGVLSWVLG